MIGVIGECEEKRKAAAIAKRSQSGHKKAEVLVRPIPCVTILSCKYFPSLTAANALIA
jgi:hypothetical protein